MSDKPNSRICRICWNTNGWTEPSGTKGKSKGISFEKRYGFGNEEWLFRKDFRIDGFQYGFLEPINKFPQKYQGETLDLHLYTIDGEINQKYWVGEIRSVEVLTDDQIMEIRKTYIDKGWMKTMENELKDLQITLSSEIKKEIKKKTFFLPNVRFKVSNINLLSEIVPVVKNDPIISANRYILLHMKGKPKAKVIQKGFNFAGGNLDPGPLSEISKCHKFKQTSKESPLTHNKLISEFQKYLQKKFGKSNVRRECPSNENRIDLVRRDNDSFIFYEIKTYNHVRTSLRVGIGQLLEYTLFPDEQFAVKIVLVTETEPDTDTVRYIRHMNKFLKIPFGFIYFDLLKNEIALEI